MHRSGPDEYSLKVDVVLAKHPAVPLQRANERRQITFMERPADLPGNERLPGTEHGRARGVDRRFVDEFSDKPGTARSFVDIYAKLGIERDGALQDETGDSLVPEATRGDERVVDHREVAR